MIDPGHVAGLVGKFIVQGSGTRAGSNQFTQALQDFGLRLADPNAVLLERSILSPQEWLDDPYYSGPLCREFWPRKRKDFVEAADGSITEVVLTGSIGGGKSRLAQALCMYQVYRLSCLVDPQRVLGTGQADALALVLISLNLIKARAKLYTPLKAAIDATPYFRQEFRYDERKVSCMEFPKQIVVRPDITSEGAVHSEDVIFVAVSEANFLPVIQNSARKRGSDVLDVAADLVEATIVRMQSRFQQGNRLPLCKLVLDSSRQYPDDFVERRIADIEAGRVKHRAVIISRSVWEAKEGVRDAEGKPYFSGETFPVEVGDEHRISRPLTPEEVPYVTGKVVDVPVELRDAFTRDVERALRDLAGVAVLSIHPLIANREALDAGVRTVEAGYADHECLNPFGSPSTNFRDGVRLHVDVLVDPRTGKPRIRPDVPRTVHVDVGLTNDCLGLAMGHVAEMVVVNRLPGHEQLDIECLDCHGDVLVPCRRCNGVGIMRPYGIKVRCAVCRGEKLVPCGTCGGTGRFGRPVLRPRIYLDMALQVVPPPNGAIQLDDVEVLLKQLRDGGFIIAVVTADGTQSAQFLQHQSKVGAAVAEKLSVDTSKDPYFALRDAITDRAVDGRSRFSCHEHPVLFHEVGRVEDRPQKIDHPHHGAKDTADAAAGVVWNCERIPQLQVPIGKNSLSVERFARGARR